MSPAQCSEAGPSELAVAMMYVGVLVHDRFQVSVGHSINTVPVP